RRGTLVRDRSAVLRGSSGLVGRAGTAGRAERRGQEVVVQVRTRHTPSFGVARLVLAPGEPVQVESGAMLASSYGVTVEARAQGGFLKSLARAALGGESFFVSTYTAPQQGGWVDVAPNLPGDLNVLEL